MMFFSPAVLPVRRSSDSRQFRPSIFQQIIRASLHMVQFGVAYFVMLLAMYYNGYLIISILIGAFLGAFVFSWETLNLRHATLQQNHRLITDLDFSSAIRRKRLRSVVDKSGRAGDVNDKQVRYCIRHTALIS